MAYSSPNDSWTQYALALLRIIAGLMFLFHGLEKFFGFPEPPSFGYPPPFGLIWWSALLELVGGALLVLGLFTRPVAFILSGEMAVAYFIAHAGSGQQFYPIVNHGELAVLYCFVFFYLFAAGGGAFSLDHLWQRRGAEPA